MEKFETSKIVLIAIIRWAVGFIGLELVKRGIIDVQTAEAWGMEIAIAVAGAVVFGGAVAWKWFNARYSILVLEQAVQTEPPADTKTEIKAAVKEVKKEVKQRNTVAAY